MVEKHISAEQDYMQGLKYKEIAEKYDVTLNTVKSWKQRHGWQRNKGAPDAKGVHTKRRGAPDGNKNALGNEGGAPKGNHNAVTHGLFRKFLPDDEETLEIFDASDSISPLDILWTSIRIKWTNIVRSQKIMFVRDHDDLTKVLKRTKDSDTAVEREWELQHAWDKQAVALNAQARAMSELRSLIKQYEEMCRQGLADKEQQLRIDKLKGEVAVLEQKATGNDDKPIEITIKRATKSEGNANG